MPQTFNVLNCSDCGIFQVHQVVKAKKWSCKMCGVKQSFSKVFGEGTGPECRQHVQKLNMAQSELSPLDVAIASWVGGPTDHRSDTDIPNYTYMLQDNKWIQYVEGTEHLEEDSSDPDSYSPDFRTFEEKHVITRRTDEPMTKQRKLEFDVSNDPGQSNAEIVTRNSTSPESSFTKTDLTDNRSTTGGDEKCGSLEGGTDSEKCLLSGIDEPAFECDDESDETETETDRNLVKYQQRQSATTTTSSNVEIPGSKDCRSNTSTSTAASASTSTSTSASASAATSASTSTSASASTSTSTSASASAATSASASASGSKWSKYVDDKPSDEESLDVDDDDDDEEDDKF